MEKGTNGTPNYAYVAVYISVKTCSICVTATNRPQTRSNVPAATRPHSHSIVATADVRYTHATPIQINAVSPITCTTN